MTWQKTCSENKRFHADSVLRIARHGSHQGAGLYLPTMTPDRFAQAFFTSELLYLAKIGLTIDFLNRPQRQVDA
jgi:hypothetical protein